REVVAGNMTIGRDCGKWVAVNGLARKGGKHAPVSLRDTQSVGQIRLQDCRWSYLEKDAIAFADKVSRCFSEAHRVAYIAPPVIGVELIVLDCFTGNRRYQFGSRSSGRQTAQAPQQILADWVHFARVKREIEIKWAKPQAAAFRFGFQALNLCAGPGDS